ncbi:unnamed protein product [Chondrus crispus]|uniref:Uncharacterized protein n=1 Tax=Chondrus crispus TaxID=2769 RepID=R7QQT0_CHOCR|nr:unnamed protein product [Chondrus crispus]CDF39745.1 unnamed protein product [Chondrus crispus]|eukprot:XP_005710039.1 unnamed protein product [Chondrus crispus]
MRRSCSSEGEAGGTNFLPLKNSPHGLADVHSAETWTLAFSVGVASAGTDLDSVVENVAREASDRANAAAPPPLGGAEADGIGDAGVAMAMRVAKGGGAGSIGLAMQEDPDGFVRTVEAAPDSDFDDDASALEFGSEDGDDGDDVNPAKPFFEPERPAGWDLSDARAEAAKPRPFQTSIDEKIKTHQKGLTEPPKEGADEEKGELRKRKRGGPEAVADVEAEKGPKKGKKRLRKERAAAKNFVELHLSRALQKAVEQLEWHEPTPIQSRAIPYILAGRDICGSAVTGSGKTGAFVLPVLERLLQAGVDNVTRVVMLLPTRELAAQCHAVIKNLAKYTSIRAALAVGGLSNKTQEAALRTRPHILVATPGRLIDHIRNAHGFSLDDIEVLIMDEADRLLEMGFQAEVEEIVRNTRAAGRQTLLFSATMTDDLKGLIKLSLQNPINLAVDPVFDVATTLAQEFLKSAELHGNLTQAQRLAALDTFRDGTVDFLLCTDLAARGLDIAGVETVINYDLPGEVKEYVHRVGRTARAGKQGRACSIVCSGNNDERRLLKGITKRAQGQLSARIVPPSAIGKWRAWIDSLEPAAKAVLKEEKQEKEMRLAEMELSKASNILKHSDDIYSRPARTWFQNEEQKRESKVNARMAKGLGPSLEEKVQAEKKKQKKLARERQTRDRESAELDQGHSKQRADARNAKKNNRLRNWSSVGYGLQARYAGRHVGTNCRGTKFRRLTWWACAARLV